MRVLAPFWIPVNTALDYEASNALAVTQLYSEPAPSTPGAAGTLLRAEPFAGYSFPPGWTPKDLGYKTVRFLYRSRSVAGADVPASGVIVIPGGQPPSDGWPVLVWAHGTSGVGRRHAPSLMRDLYYGWRGFLEWVALGYAIVAVDYAGLGTEVVHQYIAAPAQANDVLFAVPAARAAVPELGRKWVAIGHSQGGTAVVAVAEMQSELQDPDYLGALALAPVGDVEAIFSTIDASPVRGYAVFLSYGVKAVHAEFEHADMLTPDAVRLMSGLKTDGWAVTLARVADRIPPGKVMRPDWRENRHLQEFRRMSLLGSRRASGPVLLLAGDADGTVRAPTVEAAYQRMREQGSEVELRVGAGLDHDPLVFETFPEQLAWVQDRFGGRPATAGN